MSGLMITDMRASAQQEYKEFFMQGLLLEEAFFRISPNDERDAPFPTKGTADSFTLGAYVDDRLVGVVSFEREGKDREKLQHKGLLFRMFVAPIFRGQGIGKALIATLINRVQHQTDIEQINLTVVAHNYAAKSLYQKFGFTTFSTERHAIKWKGHYFTEEQMVLPINQKTIS